MYAYNRGSPARSILDFRGVGVLFLHSILLLSRQTGLGRTVFEWSALPLAAAVSLFAAVLLLLPMIRSTRSDLSGSRGRSARSTV